MEGSLLMFSTLTSHNNNKVKLISKLLKISISQFEFNDFSVHFECLKSENQ